MLKTPTMLDITLLASWRKIKENATMPLEEIQEDINTWLT